MLSILQPLANGDNRKVSSSSPLSPSLPLSFSFLLLPPPLSFFADSKKLSPTKPERKETLPLFFLGRRLLAPHKHPPPLFSLSLFPPPGGENERRKEKSPRRSDWRRLSGRVPIFQSKANYTFEYGRHHRSGIF